ncbi:MAG: HAD-IIIA family hydrolase [Magnetococcales bacterium]|nr:HAD-IIIA family hydrolase [Magnetococcales bacterium]
MVALDVDGVLTDGGIYLDDTGSESKRFYVRDGLGIHLLLRAGLHVGLLTARQSPVVAQRAKELSLSFVHQGVTDKWACLQHELAKYQLDPIHCAYMGDDWVDLPVLQQVGLATAPADADWEVCRRVHWVATARGGQGAVRQLAENLLRTQNRWGNMIAAFLEGPSPPREHS